MKNVGEPSLAIARLALILKVAANIYIQPFALLQDALSHVLTAVFPVLQIKHV